jgi:hypothetical protein
LNALNNYDGDNPGNFRFNHIAKNSDDVNLQHVNMYTSSVHVPQCKEGITNRWSHFVTTSETIFMAKKALVPAEKIDRAILFLRNKRVMLDADLALVFGTTAKKLNQQVKRNLDRFPADFLFQLTDEEKA